MKIPPSKPNEQIHNQAIKKSSKYVIFYFEDNSVEKFFTDYIYDKELPRIFT